MLIAGSFTKYLRKWGADFTGFSELNAEDKEIFGQLKYAVTVGIRLSDAIIDQITDKPTYTYFHHYRAVNTLIDQITLRGSLLLQQNGYNALAVPASQTVNDLDRAYSGIYSHKKAAFSAGLGWIGRSNLFISSLYGPRVRLGTILTDMKLPVVPKKYFNGCSDCRLCVLSCPAMALTGNDWYEGCERSHMFDARACSFYMNEHFRDIGRGSVCGICIRVCKAGGR